MAGNQIGKLQKLLLKEENCEGIKMIVITFVY